MFIEIIELYKWCVIQGIPCEIKRLYDGHIIIFPDGSDMVQHSGSYASKQGYVEPACFSISYEPVTIDTAKKLIKGKKFNNKRKED